MEEGADGLKFHVNVQHHRASGNGFAGLSAYEHLFRDIRQRFSGPLGIVPGGSYEQIDSDEVERLEQIGFDFTSIFVQHMPLFLLHRRQLKATFAVDYQFDMDLLEQVAEFPIAALEASVIPPEHYGEPLNIKDVLLYRHLVKKAGKPVIVPTQRKIRPEDTAALADNGVRAILIGAIVTGNEVDTMRHAVSRFREAIDKY